MKVRPGRLPGLLIIEPDVHGDPRGSLFESFHAQRYRDAGIETTFVQDTFSSSRKGVLRGLHFQLDRAQDKLVSILRGKVYDVVVDVRRSSPTFGQFEALVLDDRDSLQIYIPAGFAHGFCVLSEHADILYKSSDYYSPSDQHGIVWNDPDLGIDWPLSTPTLSEKDRRLPRLGDIDPEELPA